MCCAPAPCVGGALTRKDSPLLSPSPCFSSFAPAPPPQHPPGSAGPSPWTSTPACCQQPPTPKHTTLGAFSSNFEVYTQLFSSLKANPPASILTVLKENIPHVILKKCSKYRVTPVYIVKKCSPFLWWPTHVMRETEGCGGRWMGNKILWSCRRFILKCWEEQL